jgi:hypothetical protein
MPISEEQQLGRAKNAVLEFLENRITVPKIYLDAIWDGQPVDVLAIDREGAGDVHAVLMYISRYFPDTMGPNIVDEQRRTVERIESLKSLAAQYKYIAAIEIDGDTRGSRQHAISEPLLARSFATDGVGRIGFLQVHLPSRGEPRVTVDIKPERFRAKIAKLANEYIEHHSPDWELRA